MSRHSFQRCVIALAATLIAGVAPPATAQTVQTQQTPQTPPCAASQQLVGDLGFTGLQCHGCSFTGRRVSGQPVVEFSTEPKLFAITKGGPADGKLQEYDVLVALNGQLITTQAAAVLYSWPPPGTVVRVTVRRSGEIKDVDIVPAARCRAIATSGPQWTLGSPWQFQPSARSFTLPPNRGVFGISLCCESSGLMLVPFSSYPEITNVVANSPAEKAGLKVGDMLVALDGLSLKSIEGMTALRNGKPGQKVVLSLVREGDWLKLTVILGSPR